MQTPFVRHALGMFVYNAGLWEEANGFFEQSAKLRNSGHAFDWLRMAMALWHMKDAEAARHWYAMAASAATKEQASGELIALGREARKLLNSNPDQDKTSPNDQ